MGNATTNGFRSTCMRETFFEKVPTKNRLKANSPQTVMLVRKEFLSLLHAFQGFLFFLKLIAK
jgi:hypothetical protein